MIEQRLHATLLRKKMHLAVAESCTGGALSARLTAFPGASGYFLGGVIAYSNTLKEKLLTVPQEILRTEGAVSEACVVAMVEGLFAVTEADLALAISGIAGPAGGSAEKPVGTVWIALGERDSGLQALCFAFQGDRKAIIESAIHAALENLLEMVGK